jgi:hypothetical protein
MCHHVCNWRAICTDKAKTQVGRRTKDELSPFLANLCEFVPPSFAIPYLPSYDTGINVLISIKDGRSIEIEYVKKGIIVEDVDRRRI